MSLFDLLRYPISIPPTHEELEALPKSIRDTWYARKNWSHLNSVADLLKTQWNNPLCQPGILEDLSVLQSLILEHDK